MVSPSGEAFAIKSNGEMWTWGNDTWGGLGRNTWYEQVSSPVLVIGSHNFKGADSSLGGCIACKVSGEVWTWGNNDHGVLGDNTNDNRSSPVLVVGNHSFVDVCSGIFEPDGAKGGRKVDGGVWRFGSGYMLGDNTTTDKSSPVLVVGNHSFVISRIGGCHSLSNKVNGEVWSWGAGDAGRLGDNTDVNKSSPVLVVGSHSFIEIDAGSYGSAACKENGSLWAWGDNAYGALGDNTNGNRSSPVAVIGNHSFVEVHCGSISTFARKSDGKVWSWGNNQYVFGCLGTDNWTDYSSPVPVVGNHSFIEIRSTLAVGYGLKVDGQVWSWGQNTYGELGTNEDTNNSHSSPVLVVGNHSFDTLSFLSGGTTKSGPFPLAFRT